MTVVLGGGISGLSAAFYATERRLGPITLLEATDHLGGWIRTKETSNGSTFEMGPRIIRPRGLQGENTLKLLDRLDLHDKILPITQSHPAVKNRLIYYKEKLHLLPNSFGGLFKKFEPFNGPLIKAAWKDLTTPMVKNSDESIYSFTERRFGRDIADNLISPMLCGICAGDAKKISVHLMMSSVFEVEQKYGSVLRGLLKERKKSKEKKDFPEISDKDLEINLDNDIEDSMVVKQAKMEKWALWGLKGGFQQLPKRLVEKLNSAGTEIHLKEKCEKITFVDNSFELKTKSRNIKCSRLISSLSAKALAPLLEHQYPELAKDLSEIPYVDVALVNLEYPGKWLPVEGFGFLVPPKEKNPILGTIFDSSVFKNENSTVLTVMMGGAWFEEHFGRSPDEDYLLKVAQDQVSNILKIKDPPTATNVVILRDCIAQHVVGHKERLERIQTYISSKKLPLALCGSSYQGIGVNDVILSAKQAVRDVEKITKSQSN